MYPPTDEDAAAILSGTIDARITRGLVWNPVNLRRNGSPTKIEGKVLVHADVDVAYELLLRLHPDRPWEYSVILLHKASGTNVRRLDIRGTHRDRRGGEEWVNRTHKHTWSRAAGNSNLYTPDDIRHDTAIPAARTMKDLAGEYQQVFEDFTAECRIALDAGYIWAHPPYPEPDQPIPTMERYP